MGHRRELIGTALAVGLLLVAPRAAFSQAVSADYRIWRPDQAVEFSLVQNEPAAFHAVVVRKAGVLEDEWRLRLAESIYPTRESLGAVPTCGPEALPENAWWTTCDPRLPYALTASAVRYYLDWIGALRRGDVQSRGQPLTSGTVRYEASGAWEADFQLDGDRFADVYVARLQLEVQMRCGHLCGWSFRKTRVVVLSRSGDVLGVNGDGRTAVAVS
jgi:hypothetical protein